MSFTYEQLEKQVEYWRVNYYIKEQLALKLNEEVEFLKKTVLAEGKCQKYWYDEAKKLSEENASLDGIAIQLEKNRDQLNRYKNALQKILGLTVDENIENIIKDLAYEHKD